MSGSRLSNKIIIMTVVDRFDIVHRYPMHVLQYFIQIGFFQPQICIIIIITVMAVLRYASAECMSSPVLVLLLLCYRIFGPFKRNGFVALAALHRHFCSQRKVLCDTQAAIHVINALSIGLVFVRPFTCDFIINNNKFMASDWTISSFCTHF